MIIITALKEIFYTEIVLRQELNLHGVICVVLFYWWYYVIRHSVNGCQAHTNCGLQDKCAVFTGVEFNLYWTMLIKA